MVPRNGPWVEERNTLQVLLPLHWLPSIHIKPELFPFRTHSWFIHLVVSAQPLLALPQSQALSATSFEYPENRRTQYPTPNQVVQLSILPLQRPRFDVEHPIRFAAHVLEEACSGHFVEP